MKENRRPEERKKCLVLLAISYRGHGSLRSPSPRHEEHSVLN